MRAFRAHPGSISRCVRLLAVLALLMVGLPPATAAAPAAAQPINLPPPELKTLKVAHSTLETSQLAYKVAEDRGLFQKYGFEKVELFYNEGDGRTLQALLSGGVDLSAQGVAVAISSQLTDTPLVGVAMTATTLTDALVAAPGITSADDLRGKPVAVSAFGGTSHGAVLASLQALGLTDRDVTIVQVGGQSSRIAALTAGSVAAAPIDVALEDEMRAQGFNILVRLPDTILEYGRNGLIVHKEWLTKYPNTVQALVASVLEAQQLLFTDTESAIDVFARWTQLQDRARAEKEVREFLKYADRDMKGSKAGWELTRDVLASAEPAVGTVDVTEAYDFSALDNLAAMGFYDAIGAPRP